MSSGGETSQIFLNLIPDIERFLDFACGFARNDSFQKRNSDNLHRTFRQRLHERAAVGFGYDAVIENDNHAAIGFGPDQTAYALSQFQDRFRQRLFSKRIATALLDQLKFRFYERMIRDGKRQSRDDHI